MSIKFFKMTTTIYASIYACTIRMHTIHLLYVIQHYFTKHAGTENEKVTLLHQPFHAAMSPLDSETHIRFTVNVFVFQTHGQT